MNCPIDAVETLAYDPETETYRLAYDTAATPPSLAVAVALESITGEERTDPLCDAIDPDALDGVLTAPGVDRTGDYRSDRVHRERIPDNRLRPGLSRGATVPRRRSTGGVGLTVPFPVRRVEAPAQ